MENTSENKGIRLNKFIADAGIASRRDADKLIEQGKVTVNGRLAEPGMRIFPKDSVKVGSKLLSIKRELIVLAYYKPVGVTCTERDDHAEITLKDAVRFRERVTYAGRLDKDSEGLLLLSNNGDLINAMMKGANGHEKEYIVKTNKPVTQEFLDEFSKGVYIKELDKVTRPCKCKELGKTTFQVVLTQGLNRQIRRTCEALHMKVVSLKRVRVLSVKLGDLKPGEYRQLSNSEVKKLCGEVGLKGLMDEINE